MAHLQGADPDMTKIRVAGVEDIVGLVGISDFFEKGFHRLKGYRSMPRLVAALRARDASLGADVDEARKSA